MEDTMNSKMIEAEEDGTIRLPRSWQDFLVMCDCDVRRALGAASAMGWSLNKYADPTEGELIDMSVEDAHEVATEDSSLIWISRPEDTWITDGSYIYRDGDEIGVMVDDEGQYTTVYLYNGASATTRVYSGLSAAKDAAIRLNQERSVQANND